MNTVLQLLVAFLTLIYNITVELLGDAVRGFINRFSESGERTRKLLKILALTLFIFALGLGTVIAQPGVLVRWLIPSPTPTPVPTATATQTPIPPPTSAALPRCVYQANEWPCTDLVRNTEPRDTLALMAFRNYGTDEPKYARLICAHNLEFLYQQFIDNVPAGDRDIWDNDPCNYLVPGNELVIPVLPEDMRQTATPSP